MLELGALRYPVGIPRVSLEYPLGIPWARGARHLHGEDLSCALLLGQGQCGYRMGREQPRPRDTGHEEAWEPTGALEDSAQAGVQGTEDPPADPHREGATVLLLCLVHRPRGSTPC